MTRVVFVALVSIVAALDVSRLALADELHVGQNQNRIQITNSLIDAAIRKHGYVSGVAAQSFVDRETGYRELGFGLDIVDWLMEPGSDEVYRSQLPANMRYVFDNAYHSKRAMRCVEGPQIAGSGRVTTHVYQGDEYIGVKQQSTWNEAAPGKNTGSRWEQTLVFPEGKTYFFASDKVTSANASEALSLRIDMPGHIRHKAGNTFSEIYLSYHGRILSEEFRHNFAPDEKFYYLRHVGRVPDRMIRAYHIRNPKTGEFGPWLAGMTLRADDVSEAWCHQRDYVCMVQDIGGREIQRGGVFSAAYIIGFFDSIEDMHDVYDQYVGHDLVEVNDTEWKLIRQRQPNPIPNKW